MSVEKSRWRGRWLPANAGATVVPLYSHPQPTLTAAERECLEWAEEIAGNCEEFDRVEALRGLLDRLGGER